MSAPVQVTFLGGLGEIGRNCAVLEIEGRLIVLDCGQMFGDETTPGVDTVLPDFGFLRDRADDVKLLAFYFLQKYNKIFERNLDRIAPGAMSMLQQHDYRENNVRELEHMIQRAVALAQNEVELTDEQERAVPQVDFGSGDK